MNGNSEKNSLTLISKDLNIIKNSIEETSDISKNINKIFHTTQKTAIKFSQISDLITNNAKAIEEINTHICEILIIINRLENIKNEINLMSIKQAIQNIKQQSINISNNTLDMSIIINKNISELSDFVLSFNES